MEVEEGTTVTISLCVPVVIFYTPLDNTALVVKPKLPDAISGMGEPSDKVCGVAAALASVESEKLKNRQKNNVQMLPDYNYYTLLCT